MLSPRSCLEPWKRSGGVSEKLRNFFGNCFKEIINNRINELALNPILLNSLDLTPDGPFLMLEESLTGSKAWYSEELSKQDWTVEFSEEALDEVRVMAERIRANPLPIHLREPDEFQIPKLRQTLSLARKILDQGCGFCVMERMPMEEISKEEMISCYWVISQLVGRPVA